MSGSEPAHEAWEHRTAIPAAVRDAVLQRDNYQCQLCGTSGENRLQLHHWEHFRSHGGAHTPQNLVTLCFRCHDDVHAHRRAVVVLETSPGVFHAFPQQGPRR